MHRVVAPHHQDLYVRAATQLCLDEQAACQRKQGQESGRPGIRIDSDEVDCRLTRGLITSVNVSAVNGHPVRWLSGETAPTGWGCLGWFGPRGTKWCLCQCPCSSWQVGATSDAIQGL